METANVAFALVFLFMAGCEGGERPAPGASTAPEDRPTPPDTADATWTAGATEQQRPEAEPVLLAAVRTGRHKGFDRIVFVFKDHLPGYRIEYVGHPVHACGSGKSVALAGEGRLRVRFYPARAYTQDGVSTIEDPERTPGLSVLKELEMTCSGFEADVTWALGLADSTRYRVRELMNPPRLVVDMRHP